MKIHYLILLSNLMILPSRARAQQDQAYARLIRLNKVRAKTCNPSREGTKKYMRLLYALHPGR